MDTRPARQAGRSGSAVRTIGGRLRRLFGLAAAVSFGLMALGATASGAFAEIAPPPGGGNAVIAPVPPATIRVVRVVTSSGLDAWQITLVAVGAALLGAVAAVLVSRARAVRRTASASPA